MIQEPTLDPLQLSTLGAEDLVAIADANEMAAAHLSLDAELRHWQDGHTLTARDWISSLYTEVESVAKQQGFGCFLLPLKKILREGNEAQQWLRLHQQGMDVPGVLQKAIQAIADQEALLADEVCQPLVA
jgi:predicted glutamate--cysteine ligase